MPFNGSGVYTPISSPDFPAVPLTTIRAAQYNNEINDIATALSTCITRNGQSTVTANLPMGGFNFTGLAAPLAAGQALVYGQDATVANLAVSGTGKKITGEFTGTLSNRVLTQTSTINGITDFTIVPNGSATSSSFLALNSSTLLPSSYGMLQAGPVEVALKSGFFGAGSYLPITFYTGGSEKMRIDTSGRVSIGTTSTTSDFEVGKTTVGGVISKVTNADTAAGSYAKQIISQGSVVGSMFAYGNSSFYFGTESAHPLLLRTNGTDKFAIGVAGDIGINGSYGTAGQVFTSGGAGVTATWTTPAARQIQPISASVAANALTISASALNLDFRSTTLGSGTVTTVSGTPANLVISSGSTLGTTNALQSKLVVLAINNAGTIELAAVNIAGGLSLSETGLITTVAEGGAGAADSINTVYSTTARSNVAYRVLGYIESTQATAGTWVTAPSTIQGAGGQALTSLDSLGYGQTYKTVTRTAGQTYYNTTGKPIHWIIHLAPSSNCQVTIGGYTHTATVLLASTQSDISFIVPPGVAYSYTQVAGTSIHSELN